MIPGASFLSVNGIEIGRLSQKVTDAQFVKAVDSVDAKADITLTVLFDDQGIVVDAIAPR